MKKYKLNKKGKILIITLLLVFVFFGFKLITNKKEKHILKTGDYNLKIDVPYIENKKIRKEVENYIDLKQKEFIKKAKNEKTYYPFDMNINVNNSNYKNINFVIINNYTFTGGNHYDNEKISYIFNKNKDLNIEDLLIENGLEKIANLVYYKIMQLNDNDTVFIDDWVKEGTASNLDKYKHFLLDENGLTLFFIPGQVGDYSNGEVRILLTYDEINKYLKDDYQGQIKEQGVYEEVPKTRDLNKYKNKKLIAFTYDDGPSNINTNYLLDNLDKYDAKVTFFVLGNRVKSNQDALKRAYLEGNLIGNHSYSHRNFNLLKDNEIMDEIFNTNKNIKEIIGFEPTLLRPPYGNLKNNKLTDMNIILWNIDTLDWKYRDKNKVCDIILKYAHDGAIVLAHDLYKTSIDGTLMAMEELQKQGYAFVTIDEMIKIKNIKIEENKKYYNF